MSDEFKYIDSGNNGTVFKLSENDLELALKIFYSPFLSPEVLIKKAYREYSINKLLNGIEGIPSAYDFYSEEFDFKYIKKKSGVADVYFITKDVFEFDESEIVFSGAFTMDYMNNLFKLPKYGENVDYRISNKFFDKLEYIANQMTSRGVSLPPESDILVTIDLEPLVVDFGNSFVLSEISESMGNNRASKYIDLHNKEKIKNLRIQYQH